MKLSAFLIVTVPIVAVAQAPAIAGDNSAWLQDSISTLSASKPAAAHHKTAKRVAHAAPALRMRSFKPGRFLPSERDLRQAMVEQQAQYDYSADQAQGGALSGQVTTAYAAAPRAMTVYDQYAMPNGYNSAAAALSYAAPRVKAIKKALGTRAPRVMPNQMPMLPEQLTQAKQVLRSCFVPEPPVQRQIKTPFPVSMPVAPFPQPPVQQQQQYMPQQQYMQAQPQYSQPQAVNQFQPSDFSAAEMAELHKRVEMNPPTARTSFNGDMTGQAFDNPSIGTGQAAFPLNAIMAGGNPMQNLARGGQRKIGNVPQARFGSWHGNSGLPDSGFQAYVGRRRSMSYDYSRATVAPITRRTATVKHSSHAAPRPMAHLPQKQKQVVVATYPSYTSYRGMTY